VYAAVAAAAQKLGDSPVCALLAQLRACHGHWDDLPPAQLLAPAPSPGAAMPPASPGGAALVAGGVWPASTGSVTPGSATTRRSPGVMSPSTTTSSSVVGDDAALRLLRLMAEHRKQCERDGRYGEASAASSLLTALQSAAESARLADMRARHAAARANADEAHAADAEAHAALWDAKAAEFESIVVGQLDHLAATAAARDVELTIELAARAPRRLQPSKELLALRSKQEALARQGKYADAASVQATADRLEAAEAAAARDAFAAEASRARAAAQAKAATEKQAALQRAARGREMMRIARRADAEKLLQRYRNVLAALESTHKREAVQLDYFLTTQQLAGKRASPAAAIKTGPGSPGGKQLSEAALLGATVNGTRAAGNGTSPLLSTSPLRKTGRSPNGRSPSGGVGTGVANMRAAVARKSAGSLARAAAANGTTSTHAAS
jgi:hypothetical protein